MNDLFGPVIDVASLEAIAGLEGAGGDRLLRKVLDLYLSHSLVLLQRLESAVGAGDAQGVMEAAHTLKSSSAQIGAGRLATALREIEFMGRNREMAAMSGAFRKVCVEYDAARSVLEAYLRTRFPL